MDHPSADLDQNRLEAQAYLPEGGKACHRVANQLVQVEGMALEACLQDLGVQPYSVVGKAYLEGSHQVVRLAYPREGREACWALLKIVSAWI